MKIFKDAKGREWTVAATIAGLTRVRDLVKVDLTELSKGDPPLGTRLTSDLFLVGDVLLALVRPQLEGKATPEEFLEALDGEGMANGFAALAAELVDFFQKSGRTEQASALTAQMKVMVAAVEKARRGIEGLDLTAIVDKAFSKATSTQPGILPALSELTPDP